MEQDVIANRVVCAWCRSLIADGSDPTSHGICPECSSIFVGDTWHLPADTMQPQWLDAYIATQLQDVLARRHFGQSFHTLNTADRANLRLRVEGFVTAMGVVFGERTRRHEIARDMLRDMACFEDVRR